MEKADSSSVWKITTALKLDDAERLYTYKLPPQSLVRIERRREEAGAYRAQEAETPKELRDCGIRIGNFSLENIRAFFPADRIDLIAEFDSEQEPDNNFELLFTTRLLRYRPGSSVELEGVKVAVLFNSAHDMSETTLVRDLLDSDEDPVELAAKHVASGFDEVFPGYVRVFEAEDMGETEYGIRSFTFALARQRLDLKQLQFKRVRRASS
jgi:hypothetical protein